MFGIKNCGTCRRAIKWLNSEEIKYKFHDLRFNSLKPETVATWAQSLGVKNLLNRRSITWRNLPNSQKTELDNSKAIILMKENPILIKRPIFDLQNGYLVGFGLKSMELLAKHG